MVENIYELERHEVSRSVPVIGDFVLSSLVISPPEADIPLPDLRGLVQTPLAQLSQKLGEKSKVPTKIGIKVPTVLLPSLTPFVPPTVTDPSPPPPPVVRPVASTYREHRQNIGPAYPTSSYWRRRGNIRAQLRTLRGHRTPSPEEKQRECERRRRKKEARHNEQHRRDEKREEEKRQATQQRRPSKAHGLQISPGGQGKFTQVMAQSFPNAGSNQEATSAARGAT